jgi:hypothetical protein
MRELRTWLPILGGFLVPAVAALIILGASSDETDTTPGLETFENVNFPFVFSYPEELDAGSAEGEVPALTLDGSNVITVRRRRERVAATALPVHVAKLLPDNVRRSRTERRSGLRMVSARIPRQVEGGPAESLLYFFSADDRTFQIDCQSTPDHREELDRACRKVVDTIELE